MKDVAAENQAARTSGFFGQQRHDAASQWKTMGRTQRRNHSPAFMAKLAAAAIKGEKILIELAQDFDSFRHCPTFGG